MSWLFSFQLQLLQWHFSGSSNKLRKCERCYEFRLACSSLHLINFLTVLCCGISLTFAAPTAASIAQAPVIPTPVTSPGTLQGRIYAAWKCNATQTSPHVPRWIVCFTYNDSCLPSISKQFQVQCPPLSPQLRVQSRCILSPAR
jgi:hypothetical protein